MRRKEVRISPVNAPGYSPLLLAEAETTRGGKRIQEAAQDRSRVLTGDGLDD